MQSLITFWMSWWNQRVSWGHTVGEKTLKSVYAYGLSIISVCEMHRIMHLGPTISCKPDDTEWYTMRSRKHVFRYTSEAEPLNLGTLASSRLSTKFSAAMAQLPSPPFPDPCKAIGPETILEGILCPRPAKTHWRISGASWKGGWCNESPCSKYDWFLR